MRSFSVVVLFAGFGHSQPGPSGTPSDQCQGLSDGDRCPLTGSGNYHKWNGTYDVGTGLFRGTMVTNGCSQDAYGYCAECNGGAGQQGSHQSKVSCISLSFPYSGYETTPAAAPRRGIVGLSLAGVDIYGPLEAGFGGFMTPQPCMNGHKGSCPGGMDVPMCERSLASQCGAENVQYSLMLDTCGGHAMPYHYHKDLKCDYDHTLPGHSPLIGIALDGRGIYGLYESHPAKPTNLDPCNGHVGPTPAKTGMSGGSTSVYHYHVSSVAPYTLGCYGPATMAQCRDVTTGCATNGDFVSVDVVNGSAICYELECSCWDPQTGLNTGGVAGC